MEIGPPSFMANESSVGGGQAVPMEGVTETGKNFTNPMYEAMTGGDEASNASSYEVPMKTGGDPPPPVMAVLSPSAMMQRSSPTLQLRRKELSPSSTDTGKDTQQLVVEEDNSEC